MIGLSFPNNILVFPCIDYKISAFGGCKISHYNIDNMNQLVNIIRIVDLLLDFVWYYCILWSSREYLGTFLLLLDVSWLIWQNQIICKVNIILQNLLWKIGWSAVAYCFVINADTACELTYRCIESFMCFLAKNVI